ncbi:hypothetical protein AAG570_011191 [Ranatra chinensis]|uniref:Nuclear speckle splicing regulatory protein 1 N-terminal domain-containing protein n=1 Tax=Ranatra chinensis TaxID=642074 RepID=A0ABD0YW44_9HEMI
MPKKANQALVQKHAAFGDDSDSEKSDKGGTDWVKKSFKREAEKSVQKKQTKLEIQRALEQDASVFQYDEVYDQIELKKQETSQSKSKDRKPRYIQQLMNTAERRKIENERRIERQVQKEREAEGEEFKDKETFVTSAYKKKLEEFAKLDEEQKRADMLEEIGDVMKQEDITGFYRHLYQTTVAGEPDRKQDQGKRKRKTSASSEDKNKDADTEGSSSSSSCSSSSSDSDSDEEKSSESESEVPKRKKNREGEAEQPPEAKQEPVEILEKEVKPNVRQVPERSIWEKRTVGPVFEEALKRYYERKALRLAAAH